MVSCSALYGVYMSVVSVMFLYPSSVYLQHFYVNYEKSTSKRECIAERFYIDLKGPIGVFVPELHLTIPFSGT